jgi:hypothetical protein
MKNLAPIVLFVYNRPWHTEQTLDALMQNELADQSVLYIFADGAKENATDDQLNKIKEVRQVIRARKWCKEVHIIESDLNKGLANSVISGVTKIVNEYEKIIVLEDDLITSKKFLKFMNEGLQRFELEEKVMQISGFFFPVKINQKNSCFFLRITSSWGWATWKRSWAKFDPFAKGYEVLNHDAALADKFDLDGSFPYTVMMFQQMEFKTIDSWAIRWYWCLFKQDGLTLFPDKSMVNNIGYGMDGTHTHGSNPFHLHLLKATEDIKKFPKRLEENRYYFKIVTAYLRNINTPKRGFSIRQKVMNVKKRFSQVLNHQML